MASTHSDWTPKAIGLDVDGTLLAWVEGQGATYETVSSELHDAVHAAYDAGALIVLASGRSPHSMTRVAGLLDLPPESDEPLWMVASNGGVVFRHPGFEVVHEVTFNARPAVEEVLEQYPNALVAVEERGVGYRVNREFPAGELAGEMILADLDEIIDDEVSRVIIREPDASAEEFVEMASRLGLHGTQYFVGWTAWLDLSPVGVTKASGLELVCREHGIDASDVLAIGDGRNDIEMLRWAGRGVAMGQAVEEVRAAADHVTGTVYDDGAVTELRRYFR